MRNKRRGTANETKLEIKWNSNTPLRRGQAKQTEGRDLMGLWKAHLRGLVGAVEERFTAGATILLPGFS